MQQIFDSLVLKDVSLREQLPMGISMVTRPPLTVPRSTLTDKVSWPVDTWSRETHGCGAGSTKGTGSFSSVWQLAAVAPGGGPHESIRIDRSVTSRALDCVVNWRPRLPLQMCFTWAHMEWRLFNPHVGTPDPDPYSVRIRGQFVGWKTKKKKKTTTFILIIWTINSNDKYFFNYKII